MEVKYHPLVKRDMAEALKYYDGIATRLADEFEGEVRAVIESAAENPLRYHPVGRGFRRANLPRFPYHVFMKLMPVRCESCMSGTTNAARITECSESEAEQNRRQHACRQ